MTTTTPLTTAHLTRVQINPRSREAGRDLGDAQSLHRRVMALVPDQLGADTRRTAGVLYRLERQPGSHMLLIQSTAPLDLDSLPVGYATATDDRDITTLLTWLTPGRTIRYRIDAQPLRSIRTQPAPDEGPRRDRGRRVPLHGPDATAWWTRKAEEAGLQIDPQAVLDTRQSDTLGWKENPNTPGKLLRIWAPLTRFEGTATIADAHALRTSITTGIGRGRAYGAGLLSVAPLSAR